MKYNTVLFVNIVQLFYVCEVWSKHDYGDAYPGPPNPNDSYPGNSSSVTTNSGQRHQGPQYPRPRYPRSAQCPKLPQPKFAAMRCKAANGRRTCTAQCIAHHFFKGTRQNKMVLQCRRNKWAPRATFPYCVSDGKCGLKLVKTGQGKIACKSEKALIRCTITCDGKDYGWFNCQPSGKWSRPLPKCAKDKRE